MIFGFKDEDELEQWYSSEKERLEATFTREVEARMDDTSAAKARYSASLKQLIERYSSECEKLLVKKKK